jgi:hypothetical protein
MDNNLALFLIHNIFLTNNQIESFFKKKEIEVIGISVPVWVNAKTSETSEPAAEVFCQYVIKQHRKDSDVEILPKNGYQIFLCNKKNKKPKEINFEELSAMSAEDRKDFEKKRNKWFKENSKMILQDLKNGYYRTEIKKINQTFEKLPKCLVDVQHIVEIKTIEKLKESIIS